MDIPRPKPRWILAEADATQVETLRAELGISRHLARFLVLRGMVLPAEAERFLRADPGALGQKQRLKGLTEAAKLVREIAQRRERVTVYGDYDVDGLTGSTVLYWALRKVRAEVQIRVPDRNRDGYGLTLTAVERLAAERTKLLITVDNGTTALAEIARARELGMRIIILDHHTPEATLPRADSIINPLQSGCDYPFKGPASVSLAFKLGEAILEACDRPADEVERFRETFVDLVAIGTIADMVPLREENRHLVRRGLARLSSTAHPGLRCLIDVDRDTKLDAEFVAMRLAPKINAAGRIAQPEQALSLLLARDEREARTLARNLDALNRKRRRLVEQLVKESMREMEAWKHQPAPVLVLRTPYIGLMGLIAQRVKDLLYRPSFALALHDGVASGSGRSVEGFDLIGALRAVDRFTLRAGGHAQAVGASVAEDRLEEFIHGLHRAVEETLEADLREPRLRVDGELTPADLDEPLLRELEQAEPFGRGNEAPCFMISRVRVNDITRGGPGGHFAMLTAPVMAGRAKLVAPQLARESLEYFEKTSLFDLAGHVQRYQGGLSFVIKSLRPSPHS